MDALKRFGAVALLLGGALLAGFAAGDAPSFGPGGNGERKNYTVTELMEALPTDQRVRVTANVSQVLDDYTADSGNTYQQFYVTDGEREVKVFCSTGSGRATIAEDQTVTVSGTFQEFYGEYEIYTQCSAIRSE